MGTLTESDPDHNKIYICISSDCRKGIKSIHLILIYLGDRIYSLSIFINMNLKDCSKTNVFLCCSCHFRLF